MHFVTQWLPLIPVLRTNTLIQTPAPLWEGLPASVVNQTFVNHRSLIALRLERWSGNGCDRSKLSLRVKQEKHLTCCSSVMGSLQRENKWQIERPNFLKCCLSHCFPRFKIFTKFKKEKKIKGKLQNYCFTLGSFRLGRRKLHTDRKKALVKWLSTSHRKNSAKELNCPISTYPTGSWKHFTQILFLLTYKDRSLPSITLKWSLKITNSTSKYKWSDNDHDWWS